MDPRRQVIICSDKKEIKEEIKRLQENAGQQNEAIQMLNEKLDTQQMEEKINRISQQLEDQNCMTLRIAQRLDTMEQGVLELLKDLVDKRSLRGIYTIRINQDQS